MANSYETLFASSTSHKEKTRTMFLQIGLLTILFVVFGSFVFFGAATRDLIANKAKVYALQAAGQEVLPDIENQISIISNQMRILSTESIESRLASIETAISQGDIDVEYLSDVQEMRNDIEILKTFMYDDPQQVVGLNILQEDYHSISSSMEGLPTRDEMESADGFTQALLYATWAFFGILFTILFGGKYFNRKHNIPTTPVRATSTSPEEEEV